MESNLGYSGGASGQRTGKKACSRKVIVLSGILAGVVAVAVIIVLLAGHKRDGNDSGGSDPDNGLRARLEKSLQTTNATSTLQINGQRLDN